MAEPLDDPAGYIRELLAEQQRQMPPERSTLQLVMEHPGVFTSTPKTRQELIDQHRADWMLNRLQKAYGNKTQWSGNNADYDLLPRGLGSAVRAYAEDPSMGRDLRSPYNRQPFDVYAKKGMPIGNVLTYFDALPGTAYTGALAAADAIDPGSYPDSHESLQRHLATVAAPVSAVLGKREGTADSFYEGDGSPMGGLEYARKVGMPTYLRHPFAVASGAILDPFPGYTGVFRPGAKGAAAAKEFLPELGIHGFVYAAGKPEEE